MAGNKGKAIRRDRNGLVRCRVCGCTEIDACYPPCGWEEADLCTGCAEAAQALLDWQLGARRANMTALRREVLRRFDALGA